MLSIIIPTHNEIKNQYLQKMLPQLRHIQNECKKLRKSFEVIFVDSNSTDGTQEYIKHYEFDLYQVDTNSRAARLNYGIKMAKGKLILLHHPRSIVENDGIFYLLDNWKKLNWGAFTHRFDLSHPLLKFTSWYSNLIRGDRSKIYYLDHCIFAKKSLLEKVNLIPEIDIFEDTEICLKLKKESKPKRLPFNATTSAIRFTKNGIFKQAIGNQVLKLNFLFKQDHKVMNQKYEKDVELNSHYND